MDISLKEKLRKSTSFGYCLILNLACEQKSVASPFIATRVYNIFTSSLTTFTIYLPFRGTKIDNEYVELPFWHFWDFFKHIRILNWVPKLLVWRRPKTLTKHKFYILNIAIKIHYNIFIIFSPRFLLVKVSTSKTGMQGFCLPSAFMYTSHFPMC
jgi:hypothetical protein